MTIPAKVRKSYNYLISGAILLITWLFIYRQVFHRGDILQIRDQFLSLVDKPVFRQQLGFVIFLMLVNWGIESVKWKILIRKIERVSFLRSFMAVLTGVSISTSTPNHIGEYFGRVFVLEKGSRIEGTLATIVGSMSQLFITILTGSLGLILVLSGYLPLFQLGHGYLFYTVIVLIVALDIFLLVFFFHISWLNVLKEKIFRNEMKKFRRFLNIFSQYRHKDLCIVITLSFVRYLVFTSQYFLILRMFSVPVGFVPAFIIVSLIYLTLTAIPMIVLTEIGIRGSVAIYFFGAYFTAMHIHDESLNIAILSASTLLWIINLGIPAIIGTIFVFRLKFFRKNGG